LTGSGSATPTVLVLSLSADLVRVWATIASALVLHAGFKSPRVSERLSRALTHWPESVLTATAVLAVIAGPLIAAAVPTLGPPVGPVEARVLSLAPGSTPINLTMNMATSAGTVADDVLRCLHENKVARRVRVETVEAVAFGEIDMILRLVGQSHASRRTVRSQGAAALVSLDNSLPPWVHTVSLPGAQLDRWKGAHARPIANVSELSSAVSGETYRAALNANASTVVATCARPWD
jgi:hypothetical protein